MKLITWNVNGLRACIQKGFLDFFQSADADFFCLQETKLQEGQLTLELPGYEQYWCYAEKKGYSGTAIFTKHTPISVSYGLDIPELDTEGRLITLEYPEFFLVTCYSPNSQRELARIGHRLRWEEALRAYLSELDRRKRVILCGDLNVAHQEIDLKNPKANRESAGFSDREREAFSKLLDCGFTDIFRHRNPTAEGQYTWWSYMYNARANNAGWRIDYFVVSDRLRDAVYKTPIYAGIPGSDHCPVGLELDLICHGGIWQAPPAGTPSVVAQSKTAKTPTAKKALQGGLAVGILLLGLICGYLLRGPVSAAPPDTDPTLSTTLPGGSSDSGIAPDYASMSTLELVDQVLAISELHFYNTSNKLDTENYTRIRDKNPALLELERRPETMALLSWEAQSNSGSQDYETLMRARAADNLLTYYTDIGHQFGTSSPSVTEPPAEDPGIATDYASMSTEALVRIAAAIPALSQIGSPTSSTILDASVYNNLCTQNPVLLELEQRPDAISQLRIWTLSISDSSQVAAARTLLSYYSGLADTTESTTPTEPEEFQQEIGWITSYIGAFTIVEFSEAPLYGTWQDTKPTMVTKQTMIFGDKTFVLDYATDWLAESNFWFYFKPNVGGEYFLDQCDIEVQINGTAAALYNGDAKLAVSLYSDAAGQPEGYLLYGITQEHLTFRLSFTAATPSGGTHTASTYCNVYPPFREDWSTRELLQYVYETTNSLHYTPDRTQYNYLPMKLLYEREDFIATALQIHLEENQADYVEAGSIMYWIRDLMEDLRIQAMMTDGEKEAWERISAGEYFTSKYLYGETPNLNPVETREEIEEPSYLDYFVGPEPDVLKNIPAEERNFHIVLPLSPAGCVLATDQWYMEAEPLDGAEGTVGVLPYYDPADGTTLLGWIVTGKLPWNSRVEVRLCLGDKGVLQTMYCTVKNTSPIIYG